MKKEQLIIGLVLGLIIGFFIGYLIFQSSSPLKEPNSIIHSIKYLHVEELKIADLQEECKSTIAGVLNKAQYTCYAGDVRMVAGGSGGNVEVDCICIFNEVLAEANP